MRFYRLNILGERRLAGLLNGDLDFNLYRLNGPDKLINRTTHLAPQFASLDFQEHKE